MRLVTFTHPSIGATTRVGVLQRELVVDPLAVLYARYVTHDDVDSRVAARRAAVEAPGDMVAHFRAAAEGKSVMRAAIEIVEHAMEVGEELQGPNGEPATHLASEVILLAPVPRPPRIRDYLTFGGHVSGSGVSLPAAFDEMPICYKCNVDSVIGPNETIIWPTYTKQLDYELEVGFLYRVLVAT